MSKALLSSKIVINEEPPQIRSIEVLPTVVLGMVGVAQRGPIGQPVLVLSFEEWRSVFGGYTTASRDTVAAVEGYFEEGGQFLWFVRTVHYTDITDETSHTAAAGAVTLNTAAVSAQPASLLATNVAPYELSPGDQLSLDVDGGGPVLATIAAAAATALAGNTQNYALTDGWTLLVKVNAGSVQTVTFLTADFVDIAAATAAEVADVITDQLVGAGAVVDAGAVRINTDGAGTGFKVEVTGGTAAAAFDFPVGVQSGTGDVSNIAAVSIAELEGIIEADIAGTSVADASNRASIATTTTGAAATLLAAAGPVQAALGLPLTEATGSDAVGATPSLQVTGKWAGAYTDDVTINIADATNGDADRFNLQVLVDGLLQETFPNLSMDDTDANYVEAVVNATGTGSQLVSVVDLDADLGSALFDRPANATGVALPGGDDGLVGLADADFVGNAAAKTGLHALDGDTSQPITLLAVPARQTAVVHNAMLNYAELDRDGLVFAIIDSPAGLSAQGVLSYVRNVALLENASEHGAVFYPHVQVINPNSALFGDVASITVPPSGHIAGVMARNDNSQPGGIYTSPAGQEGGRLRTIVGFEVLPGKQQAETFDETKRDLLYPARINPLDAQGGQRIIDGARTLRGGGNFPYISERRGASFIERSLKVGLEFARFRNNDDALRAEVTRVVETFLLAQMSVGAFRTRDPSTAFFVDFGKGLNPDAVVFAGQLIGRIGLATQKPAEFILLNFTQDTRALTQELSQ